MNLAPGAPGRFHHHRCLRRLRLRRHHRRRRRRSAALVAITDAPGGTAPGAARRRTGGRSFATARGGGLMRESGSSSREATAPKLQHLYHVPRRLRSRQWHEADSLLLDVLLAALLARRTSAAIGTTNQVQRGWDYCGGRYGTSGAPRTPACEW